MDSLLEVIDHLAAYGQWLIDNEKTPDDAGSDNQGQGQESDNLSRSESILSQRGNHG